MALSSIINRKQYGPLSGITSGDLVAAWGYRISDESDLEVYVVESDGTTTGPLTQDVDYEIVSNLSGTLITSCNINAVDADKFPDGSSVIVVRQTNFLQSSDYKTNGVILSDTLENDLDKLAMQTQQLKDDITRSVRFSASLLESETPDPEISFDATARSNKVLGFDALGDFAVTQELGTFVGDWTDGTDYQTRDIVRTWGSEEDDNYGSLWIAKQSHTADAASGKSPDDTAPLASNDYWDLILDTGHFATQADVAATNANTSESKATEAEDWANKTDGDVVVDEVASGEYSAKAYAIGGTGVTSTAGKGAAKEWATKTGGTVDTSEYSAKEYATGTTVTTGSAKAWANTAEDTEVITGEYSSLHYNAKAQAAKTDAEAARDLAEDWANKTDGTVDGVSYSAKHWATQDDVGTVATNINSINTVATDINNVNTVATDIDSVNTVATGIEDVNRYAEEYTISATEPASPSEGDLWYDSTNNALKVRTATAWAVIEAVPQPLATTDSPTFAGLDVAGAIEAGDQTNGTNGQITIRSRENTDFTRTSLGALYSSGNAYYGRAVEPSTSVANGFNGGTTSTAGGGAWVIGDTGETYFTSTGGSVAMTKGSALTMYERMRIDSSGNATVSTGNLVIGTAGKGVDFAAGSSSNGITGEVLEHVETGTWSPSIIADGNAGNASSLGSFGTIGGNYTKIGDMVFCEAQINLGTKTSVSTYLFVTNIPFIANASYLNFAGNNDEMPNVLSRRNDFGGLQSNSRITNTGAILLLGLTAGQGGEFSFTTYFRTT